MGREIRFTSSWKELQVILQKWKNPWVGNPVILVHMAGGREEDTEAHPDGP